MAERVELRVSDAQGRVLRRIERGEPLATMQQRVGGAVWRMVDRMKARGWISGAYELTDLGRKALSIYQNRLTEREARFMRRIGR